MVRPSIFKSTIGLKFITITGYFLGSRASKGEASKMRSFVTKMMMMMRLSPNEEGVILGLI